jgi:tRNA(Ile)-lysidine synthase
MNVPSINAEPQLDPNSIFGLIDFEGLKSVIVAVSGGSDSLALLHLLIAFGAGRPGFPQIVAVTIDHRLRPESAGEARYVAELCEDAGVPHRILNWSGAKPSTGISAKARDARYSLLCAAARDAGTNVIFTGHTLDDQIETFVMRSARTGEGGSERGLASMAATTLLDREIWLVRPLLETSREALRNYLRAKAIGWCDDPSNDDPNYERVRIRKALKDDDRADIQRDIAQKIAQRRSLNAKAALLLPPCVTICDGLRAEIGREYWAGQDADVKRLAIGVLIAVMGGLSFLPSAEPCNQALQHLASDRLSGRVTIGRCVLELKGDTSLIYREMRSMPEITIEPGHTAIWDGRYRIENRSDQQLTIGACGTDGLRFLEENQYPGLYRASVRTCPVVLSNGKVIGAYAGPDHAKLPEGITVTRHLALFDHILSGYDEILAQSVADIFQIQAYPVNQINKN